MLGDNPFVNTVVIKDLRLLSRKKKLFFAFFLFWSLASFAHAVPVTTQHGDSANICRLLHEVRVLGPGHVSLMKLDTAEKLAKSINNNILLAKVLSERGGIFIKTNRLVAADSVLNRARKIWINQPKDTSYLFLLKKLAVCNYYLGNNKKVLDFSLEGLREARKQNDLMLQGTFNNISGIALDGMGNRARALRYYHKALNIFKPLKAKEKIASVEMNIGVLYGEQKNVPKAEKYYTDALLIGKNLKDTFITSAAYINLANIYSARKKYKKALDYTYKSLTLSKKIGDLVSVATDLNNIGDAYEQLKDTTRAFAYFRRSLKLARKIQNNRLISMGLSNLAEMYEKRGNIPLAVQYATESWKQAKQGGDATDLLASLNQLQHLYTLKRDFHKAYTFLSRYATLHDSIFSMQNEARLAGVQMEYAFEAQNDDLRLAHEKQKLFHAYFLLSLFMLILVIGIGVFFVRIRLVKDRELKKKIAFADSLLEYSESYVLMLDRNLRISYLSPSYQKTFGHYLKDRLGGDPFDFVHPDEVEKLKKILRKFFSGEQKRIEFSFRLRKSSGEYRFMQGIFNNRIDHPDLKSYVLNFWDITELRKTQQAISESEKKYYNIFNAFPDIYFHINSEGVIEELSPSVKSITGYDRKEVVGRSLYDFVEMNRKWAGISRILHRLQQVKDYNLTLYTKNGKKIYCSLNIHDVLDEKGGLIGFEGVLRDITDRVLAEKKLRESESELKEANASKDKILSIIGHDLLGPIGTQKSILDMVIDEVEDFSREEILTLLQTMKPSLDATYTMIENLLSWARIVRQTIKPNLKPNDITNIIEKSFDLLKQQAGQKNIRLVYSGEKTVQAVFDKNMIEIVVRNLLSNAIKFSNPDSEIRVAVLKNEKNIRLTVTDHGLGISKADIQKILNGKEKIESRLGTRKEKGTGLGLVVVKEFIQLNNGQLSIESRPGKGTTFGFSLPAA